MVVNEEHNKINPSYDVIILYIATIGWRHFWCYV